MTTLNASINATTPSTRRLGELLGIKSILLDRSKGTRKGTRNRPWDDTTQECATFPLTKVVVRTTIVGDCAVTDLAEHYQNTHDVPMDVVHTIPISADGAITQFELVAGERSVKGLCKRTAEARRDFEDAKNRGKTAAIVESVRDDVHTISLANVPANTAVIVRMRIVERLRVDDGRFEFRFPTTISEKCILGDAIGHAGTGVSADTDRAPDASRLTPPIRLEGGTELDLEISLAKGATDISSSLTLAAEYAADGTVVLRPATDVTCDRDIVIRVWNRSNEPTVRAYTDGERTLVVVDPPAKRRPELESPREAVFVLDRSGSMQGLRIDAAKRALTCALQALAERDTFEIIAFDASLEHFKREPVFATRANITNALKWLSGINARGSTDALPAIEAACTPRVAPGRVRTVLFLTDGDVGNDEELIAVTRRLDPATRLFVIGIGMSPSATFISRLARLGGGTHLYVEDKDDIEAEIKRFEAAMAGPMACGLGDEGARNHSQRDLFAGRAATFFLDGARERVTVGSSDGRFRGECAVEHSSIPLGALWARDRVMELEDRICMNERVRGLVEPEIAALGVAHQIQTRLTSFVAIDEKSQVNGEPIVITQPVDGCEFELRTAPVCSFYEKIQPERSMFVNSSPLRRSSFSRMDNHKVDERAELLAAVRQMFPGKKLNRDGLVGDLSMQRALCVVLMCAARRLAPSVPFMVRATAVLRSYESDPCFGGQLPEFLTTLYRDAATDDSALSSMIQIALRACQKSVLAELLA